MDEMMQAMAAAMYEAWQRTRSHEVQVRGFQLNPDDTIQAIIKGPYVGEELGPPVHIPSQGGRDIRHWKPISED